MKQSDDIANLFKQFGGKAEQYHEIGRSNEARQSRERWPLLSSIDAERAAERRPPVGTTQRSAPPEPARPEPSAGALSVFRTSGTSGRIEPRLSAPVPAAAPVSTATAPAPAAPDPVAPTVEKTPKAEFIPPRPGSLRGRPLPPAFARPSGAATTTAAGASPAPTETPTAAATPPVAEAGGTELQALFARLGRPAATGTDNNKSASLLQRLNRL